MFKIKLIALVIFLYMPSVFAGNTSDSASEYFLVRNKLGEKDEPIYVFWKIGNSDAPLRSMILDNIDVSSQTLMLSDGSTLKVSGQPSVSLFKDFISKSDANFKKINPGLESDSLEKSLISYDCLWNASKTEPVWDLYSEDEGED